MPTTDDLFNWVKDVFRNTFNNFNPGSPHFAEFRERGLTATEYLTAYVHALGTRYKELLRAGEPVPQPFERPANVGMIQAQQRFIRPDTE